MVGGAPSWSWKNSQPFGSGGSDQFTGHKQDSETGLKYFGARYYNAAALRWISADSVTAHVYDPQSLNKYAYVRNDPVNLVDPDGHFRAAVQWESWWFYDPPSSSNRFWGGGRAGQTRSGGQGGGGFGNGGPTIVTHSWLVDWFPSFFNIDTSISTATRQQVLSDALTELANRIDREDCRAFLQGVIDKLKANQVLKNEISSPADLVTYGLNKSTIYVYGATEDLGRLGKYGPAPAKSGDSQIWLGEFFYTSTYYEGVGGDQVSTLIHEMGQLGLIAANGKHIDDDVLSMTYLGYNSYDDWGIEVRTKCGPR
jgi:RHS repeat-associated protein